MMEGAGVDPRQRRWGSHSQWSLGRRYAGRGRLTCEGGDAGVVVVVSLADRTTEGEVAWEAAAAISPMRHDSVKKQRRREARGWGTGEALPASCVVDIFPVENAGKRAAIPRLMGFQRPYRLSQGSLPPRISRTGNSRGTRRGIWLPN